MKRQAYLALSIGFIVVGVILIYPAWLSQHVSQVTFLARGIILLWLLVGVGCWVVVQLLRQNGRILLRLDALEAQLQQLGTPARTGTAAPSSSALPLGSAAPEFELKDLRGERVSLSRFRGRRVLLVFFSPQCGYCARVVPDLAALPVDATGDAPLPVVVTSGEVGANRRLMAEHDVRCPVLVQAQNELAVRYSVTGTPMGYLIDEHGRIASEVAVGAPALLTLARARGDGGSPRTAIPAALGNGPKAHRGNRSLGASRINRAGLRAGTLAPDFRLPSLGGGEISLAEYRGRRVLLVFSDPHCGPCNQVAPRLEHLHRLVADIEVLMVSRGDEQENRRKVAEHGLTFPVVLQRQWELSRAYGMFATPIGYLIDEGGVIAAEVAQGAEAILTLGSRAMIPSQEEGAHRVHVVR